MNHLLIEAKSYEILPLQLGQNPYIVHEDEHLPNKKAMAQHKNVASAFKHSTVTVQAIPPHKKRTLSDIVFVANGGLSLPRLGQNVILLPNMKYPHRQAELPNLIKIFKRVGLPMIPYPGKEPFEGQAELKWFNGGRRAICGYGQRSTKQSFVELDHFFETLYGKENKPELLVIKLISPQYYHLDVAMLEHDDTKCIIHKHSVTEHSLKRIKSFLGEENVTVIDTPDSFCLNAVVDGPNVITHKLTDPKIKSIIEHATKRQVKEVDTSEFEKSGGSVRCMVLDIYH